MALVFKRPRQRDIEVAVDADIIAFRAAYVGEEGSSVGLAMSVVSDMLDTIATNLEVGMSALELYFTDSDNYRTIIDPNYKANRKDAPKPRYLKEVRELMQERYCSTYFSRRYLEADDLLHLGHVIATVDKDLLQVPGLHYNLTSQKTIRISDVEADNMLLRQAITGDSTDNIRGIRGMGPKRADAFIETIPDTLILEEKLQLVRDLYLERGYKKSDFYRCLNCVYIQRTQNPRLWTELPSGSVVLETLGGNLKAFFENIAEHNERLDEETTTQD